MTAINSVRLQMKPKAKFNLSENVETWGLTGQATGPARVRSSAK